MQSWSELNDVESLGSTDCAIAFTSANVSNEFKVENISRSIRGLIKLLPDALFYFNSTVGRSNFPNYESGF